MLLTSMRLILLQLSKNARVWKVVTAGNSTTLAVRPAIAPHGPSFSLFFTFFTLPSLLICTVIVLSICMLLL